MRVNWVISMNTYLQFIISKHRFYNTKKFNIILASRHCQSLELDLLLSIVYTASEIISMAPHELKQKLFIQLLHGQKFPPWAWLCHEDRNGSHIFNHTCFEFVKQKAFLKCFCHNGNNNSASLWQHVSREWWTIFVNTIELTPSPL